MVLTRACGVALLLALGASGCVKSAPPPVRLAERTPVAVAYVLDADSRLGSGVQDMPPEVKAQVAAILDARNLEARPIPFERYADFFGRARDTRARYQHAATLDPEAPLVLLVEARGVFFSQVSGRYRWDVYTQLSIGRTSAATSVEPLGARQELEAVLPYDFPGERAAVALAADDISKKVGEMFDSFLANVPKEEAPAAAWTPPLGDAIYFVLVDRFSNGDPANDGAVDAADAQAFHGGDLRGVLDKLDSLQALGVRTVWLSPVFQMRTEKFHGHGAFHGYWVEDLSRVEPRFGDEALLVQLSEELRRRGMRLVLDVVLNHVGPETRLSRERPEWFHKQGPIEDWKDPVQLVRGDVHGLPDLAVENEEVYAHLLTASKRWVDVVRPAGFRLDAVKHVPLSFWARYNEELRRHAGPDFLLLGEMLEGDPSAVADTQAQGRFGAMFDFPLGFALVDVFCRGRSPSHLGAVLFNDRLYAHPGSLVTLVDNHDLPRVLTECGGDVERVKRALAVQLTARGVPALTYGIEEGLTGKKEPENRADMRFTPAHPLRAWIAGLLDLRRRSDALQHGESLVLAAREGFFAYARVVSSEAVVVAVNGGTAPAAVEGLAAAFGPKADVSDALTGQPLASLEVPPGGVLLARLRSPVLDGFRTRMEEARKRWGGKGETRVVELSVEDPAVRLVGSGPELGAWASERALKPGPRGFQLALPVGGVFEYKLVREEAPGKLSWEEGANRVLHVPAGTEPLRFAVAWGKQGG
ncbi:alpha-amylase family glycosyl hydrolase [Myxococcaceae bacterium GXIMD 01537]